MYFITNFHLIISDSDKIGQCCLDQDNPLPFLSVRPSCSAASELSRVHWKSSDLNPLDYSASSLSCPGAPCWKSTANSSRRLRRLMSWKLLCRLSGNSCHKNTWTRRWRPSSSTWLPIHGNDDHFEHLSPSLHPHLIINKPSHQQTNGEKRCLDAEKWGLSRLKQHNFVILHIFKRNFVIPCFILLLNSCVKFHGKICTHCWNINKRHYRLCSPCT